MKHNDAKFKATGIKYVMVVPYQKFGVNKTSSRYVIEWTTSRTISEVRKDVPTIGTVQYGHYNTYKYVAYVKGEDLTISLTPMSGDPNLLISINPSNSNPTIDNNDFHSKKVGSDSITIKGDEMFSKNPTCSPVDLNLVGSKPCEVYIAIYCAGKTNDASEENSCSYSLKFYTTNQFMHSLLDGIPQKDGVLQTRNIYYSIDLTPNQDYLYVATTAFKGDVDTFISFESHNTREDDMKYPSGDKFIKKGKQIGHSQLIHFSSQEITNNCKDYISCIAIISVVGQGAVQTNEYSIVAYTHVPRLSPNTPMIGKASEDSTMYFSYTSFCETCSIIISASSYAVDSDLDLLINVGAEKDLPTIDKYDIISSQWFTEVINIDPSHEYFVKNKIKSMKQTFIIGVYSATETTFSIEIEESSNQIKKIRKNQGIQFDQELNDLKYYAYTHDERKNLKFELTMLSGSAIMRVNKYQSYENDEPEYKFLPQNNRSSLWKTTSASPSTILIADDDENFCSNCIYFIGIESSQYGAKYILEVQTQEVITTKQIKVGIPIKDQVMQSDIKEYVFVLNRLSKFRVHTSVYIGEVTYSIGNEKDYKKPIKTNAGSFIEITDKDLKNFDVGSNVYIKVKGEFEHSEYVILVTHDDSFSILPDSLPQEFTINPQDSTGIHLIYYPPALQIRLKMQLNSFSDGLFYDVYVKQQYVKDLNEGVTDFPKENESKYKRGGWDKDRRLFTDVIDVNPEKDDPFIYLVTVIPKVTAQSELDKRAIVKFNINFSSQQVNYLLPNVEVEDYLLADNDKYSIYKFFAAKNSDLEIILIPCVCNHVAFVYSSLDEINKNGKALAKSSQYINGQKTISLKNFSGPLYVKVVVGEKNITKVIDPTET